VLGPEHERRVGMKTLIFALFLLVILAGSVLAKEIAVLQCGGNNTGQSSITQVTASSTTEAAVKPGLCVTSTHDCNGEPCKTCVAAGDCPSGFSCAGGATGGDCALTLKLLFANGYKVSFSNSFVVASGGNPTVPEIIYTLEK
jgi:hypothetical protein